MDNTSFLRKVVIAEWALKGYLVCAVVRMLVLKAIYEKSDTNVRYHPDGKPDGCGLTYS